MTVSGFVLTGGQSSRMGADKALLPFRGAPLGTYVASVLRAVCPQVTVVGDPARHATFGCPVIPDLHSSIGPLGGIEAALAASTTPWVLVAACDLPALTPEFLSELIAEADRQPEADAILPIAPGAPANPLCALYHRRILPKLREAIAHGDYKVTRALTGTELRLLPVDQAGPLRNANTPAQWQELLKELEP